MKLILLCVWAEPAVLGSAKTALEFKFSQILLGDKNATSLCSKNISTLLYMYISGCGYKCDKFICVTWRSVFSKRIGTKWLGHGN